MQGRLTTIRATDGQRIVDDFTRPVKLAEMQRAVGGDIEVVPAFKKFEGKPCVAFCNEEGKLEGLPVNTIATRVWHEQTGPHNDFLVGDICIVTGDAEFMSTL